MAKTLSTKEAIRCLTDVWERESGPQTCLGYGDDEPFKDRLNADVSEEKDILLAMRQTFGMLHHRGWSYGDLIDVAIGYLRNQQRTSIEFDGHD